MPAFLLPILAFYSAIPDWLKKLILTVLIGASLFAAGDIRGKRVARAECEEQARRAQRAADAQDLQAEKEGRAQDLEITNSLTEKVKEDNDKIEALKQQLAKLPSAQCVYDKSTADPDAPRRRLRP